LNFLAQFGAKVLELIAVPIVNWIVKSIESAIERAADRRRIAEANKAIKEKLLAAKTKEEKDAAIRDLINRL
jgi:hypothetical protein